MTPTMTTYPLKVLRQDNVLAVLIKGAWTNWTEDTTFSVSAVGVQIKEFSITVGDSNLAALAIKLGLSIGTVKISDGKCSTILTVG